MLHLNVHSVYSYKEGLAYPEDIAKASKQQGNDSFCITDLNSLTAFIKAESVTKKSKNADVKGMKFIHGMELSVEAPDWCSNAYKDERLKWLAKEMKLKRTTDELREKYRQEVEQLQGSDGVDGFTVVLIAINQAGFENLVNLYNASERNAADQFMVTREVLLKHTEGLVCILKSTSEPQWMHAHGYVAESQLSMQEYVNGFEDRLYVGLETISEPQFVEAVKGQWDVKFVGLNDVRYVNKSDRNDWRLFRNLMSVNRIERFQDNLHMVTDEEYLNLLPQELKAMGPAAIAMTHEIGELVEPMEFPHASPLQDRSAELRKLCEEGWAKLRKGTDREQESRERMEYELSVINMKGFSEYFIKVLAIVKVAHELGILIGPARGSGGGCEVCYLLGITKVDPLYYNLYFERFLNPGRPGYPDIDMDFSAELSEEAKRRWPSSPSSRDAIMSELVKQGHFDFAGYIQNEVRATTLVLFKSLAKWIGIPFEEANKITAMYADKLAEKEYTGWLHDACISLDFEWEYNWEWVEQRVGFCYRWNKVPYNSSTAASGVIMINGKAKVPVREGVVMYNGVDLESYGFIKYDILTVTSLDLIQKFYGLDFDWNDVYDDKVWDTICKQDTDFVFQFASPGMKGLIAAAQPRTIDTLAELNALYRPGPLEGGIADKYSKVKRGLDAELTEEEAVIMNTLKKVFGDQHSGLMVFQEDVMRVCTECAGFNMTEADDIRKAMGKKSEEVLAEWEDPFCKNWTEEGDPTKVWETMKGFAHYAFNKSHSVAYAIIAYTMAKIWTYQRDEMLEYLLNDGTKDNFSAAMSKCKELHFRITYPSIEELGDKQYWIETTKNGSVLHVPIESEKRYGTYAQLLFDDEAPVAQLIYKGVCDGLTPDREALAELATTLLAKPKRQALYMEPDGQKFTRLEPILDGLKMCGAVVDWVANKDGSIDVSVTRGQGKPASKVHFMSKNDPKCKAEQVKYDIKNFATVRNGVLSDLPKVETSGIINQLENIKQRSVDRGEPEKAYQRMRDHLADYMREYFSTESRRVYEGVYAVLTDVRMFEKSAKVYLMFNDVEDIFYVGREYMDIVRGAPKNALLRLKMDYSPFINKKREQFVYDFDILGLEIIK